MQRITDDLGREQYLARTPQRVVSLVPSETETLFDLGVGDRLIGRTRYCEEPADRVAEVPAFGGTKDPDVDAIAELAPDLVLANQEENSRPPLEKLRRLGIPVFISFPVRATEAIAHVARLARILGIEREPAARELVRRGYQALSAAAERTYDRRLSVFVPIWMDPLMTFSGETYASDLLALAGADNVFADRKRNYPLAADLGRRVPMTDEEVGERDTRYPRITRDELIERAPGAVLLPDEPHPFGEAERAEFSAMELPAAERGAIRLTCGKDLFWYGSRTPAALERLTELIASLPR